MTNADGGAAADADDDGACAALEGLDVRRIRAVLLLGGVPWDSVEDGLQQVRVRLLEVRSEPERLEIRDPTRWGSVVASRIAVDWHRKRYRDRGLCERLASQWSRQPPHCPSDQIDLALVVAGHLDTLTRDQRQVLVLRYFEDLSIREISVDLHVPEGTVKSRLHAAVAALRGKLTTRGEQDDTH